MSLVDNGWAPVHRRLLRTAAWRGQSASTKVVLIWILTHMRHFASDSTPAGAVDVKLSEISADCETSDKTTGQALTALADAGFIRRTLTGHGQRIAVVGWRQWLVSTEILPGFHDDNVEACADESPQHTLDLSESPSSSEHSGPSIITREGEKGSAATQQRASADTQVFPSAVKDESYKLTIKMFHDRYVAAYGGKPTWGAAAGQQLKRLLATHGAEEVQRRIAVLFESPPRWLRPPFTFMSLVKNFDALVVAVVSGPSGRRGGMTPAEIMQHATNTTRRQS